MSCRPWQLSQILRQLDNGWLELSPILRQLRASSRCELSHHLRQSQTGNLAPERFRTTPLSRRLRCACRLFLRRVRTTAPSGDDSARPSRSQAGHRAVAFRPAGRRRFRFVEAGAARPGVVSRSVAVRRCRATWCFLSARGWFCDVSRACSRRTGERLPQRPGENVAWQATFSWRALHARRGVRGAGTASGPFRCAPLRRAGGVC